MQNQPPPPEAGSYLVFYELGNPTRITVGRLGVFDLPAGIYVYAGSAHGPGGLRSRLRRHLGPVVKRRWHVDWLHPPMLLLGFHYQTGSAPLECTWAQALAALPGADIPIPTFGAGDCRAGCEAHLVYIPPKTPWNIT